MIPARNQVLLVVLLAGTMLAGLPAAAQSLRGTVEDDPIKRVGQTASESSRNTITPTGRRATDAPLRQNARPRVAGRPASGPAVPADPDQAAGTAATIAAPRRPAQQNFRSLERPINTAVPVPGSDQIVHQGLATPVQPRRARASVTDPYAPLGLRVGTLLVFPTLDAQVGYDSNPERRASGLTRKGSTYARGEAGFTARSDWSVHELTADFRGGYNRYFANPEADRPDAQGRVGLRLDYTRDTAFNFELRGRLDTQTPGTANLTGRAEGRPLTYQTGATAGITQRFNRLALSASGTVDRSDFADAPIGNGQVLSQKDRNFTQYGLRLRSGYEVTPGLIPFAEVLLDTRRHDEKVDSTGFLRDSNGLQVRGGTSFEITRTLTGEVAAGYGLRRYEDQRLRDIRGPVVEGTLAWTASPLTTVRLRGVTEFEETTQTGSSGSITRRLSAELSHAFLRNLVFNAGASVGRSEFNGISRKDDTLRANLGLDYSITRNLVLRGSYTRERTTSNAQGNNVSANVWLFGARVQY